MKLPPDDQDLRGLFAQQRRADQADVPVWRDEWLQAGTRTPAPRRAAMRWLPVALGMACLAFAALLWMPSAKPQADLSEALPALFDAAPPGGLFAELEPSFTVLESPSDFLLPNRLPSNLSLFNRP